MIRTYMPAKSPRHFVVRAELRNTHRASASVVPQIPRGAHATISATTRSPARHVRESGSEHLDHAQIAQALDFWKQSRFKEAELVFETHLTKNPDDVKGWIMFAQLQKKPRIQANETLVHRLRPGRVTSSDVLVSVESVYRARTTLLLGLEHNSVTDRSCRAPLIQALGLLELTNGYEIFGSSLIEAAVHDCASLMPVLRWRRVREVRRNHVVSNPARMQKMRQMVLARFA